MFCSYPQDPNNKIILAEKKQKQSKTKKHNFSQNQKTKWNWLTKALDKLPQNGKFHETQFPILFIALKYQSQGLLDINPSRYAKRQYHILHLFFPFNQIPSYEYDIFLYRLS